MTRALVAGVTGALVVLAGLVGLLVAAVWLTEQQARRAERAAAVRAAEALAGGGVMTSRPEWPPEVREAYERGAAVWWSPVRGRWVADGRVVEVAEQPSEEIGQLRRRALVPTTEESSPVARRYPYRTLSPTVDPRPAPPARCPRCNGRILRATDEHGAPDAHCVACGHRPADVLDPARAAAMMRERDGYDDSGRKRRTASLPRLKGGSR